MKSLTNYCAGCLRQARRKPTHEKGPVATPAPVDAAWEYR